MAPYWDVILLEDDLLRSHVHLVWGGVFFHGIADENTDQNPMLNLTVRKIIGANAVRPKYARTLGGKCFMNRAQCVHPLGTGRASGDVKD